MIRVAAVVGDCGDFLSRMITNDEDNVVSWITMNCFSSCLLVEVDDSLLLNVWYEIN